MKGGVSGDWPMADVVAMPGYSRDHLTICHHEAGHAVLGVLFGLPIGAVHVAGRDNQDGAGAACAVGEVVSGKVELILPDRSEPSETIPDAALRGAGVRIAAMYMAGVMAELLLHGIEVRGLLNLDTPDWFNARAVLLEAFRHDRALYFSQYLATMALARNWDWVEAVALTVAEAGTITVDAVRSLCPAGSAFLQ